MKKKPRIVIFERREMVALSLLGLSVLAMVFTYGIHLGKKVTPWTPELVFRDSKDHAPLPTENDEIPNRQELTEQGKVAPQMADSAMSETLREEVDNTGVRLTVPVQTELPLGSKTRNAGATGSRTGKATPKYKAPVAEAPKAVAAEKPATSPEAAASKSELADLAKAKQEAEGAIKPATSAEGNYLIQVGSHTTEEEAREQQTALKAKGIPALMKTVDLASKSDPSKKHKWYRVYAGGFSTQVDAEKTAASYKTEKKIGGYLIVPANK